MNRPPSNLSAADYIEGIKMAQKQMRCPKCGGIGIYDDEQDRFFCMDCGFDSKEEQTLKGNNDG